MPSEPVALRPLTEFPMRYESRLNRRVRVDLQVRREEILTEVARLDTELVELSTARRELLDELTDLRDRLWPRVEWCHGRRPPRDDQPPMPPLTDETRPLTGRALRSTCLAIIRRHGSVRLDDLHRLLHLYGYAVASPTPVKALADAMGYEVARGRLRRPERAVYEAVPRFRPRAGRHGAEPRGGLGPLPPHHSTVIRPLDPVITDDPESWYG
jgi:hypothetical protein